MTEPLTSRRDLLAFLGRSAAVAALAPVALTTAGCKKKTQATPQSTRRASLTKTPPLASIPAHNSDSFVLASGFSYNILVGWGDAINQKGEAFGYNNDFTAYMPIKGSEDGFFWVNHESPHRLFVGKAGPKDKVTAAHIEREREAVGGSLMRIKRDAKTGLWQIDKSDPRSRRYSAKTPIAIAAPRAIAGKRMAAGTLANCCGGQTPWGTFLTCEENYDEFYGEAVTNNGKRTIDTKYCYHGWHQFFPEPPEHYGWVVEINPKTGAAQKLTALGRFAHEGAAVTQLKDGRCVVYMGDDRADQCIYKFVGATPNQLTKGELFVANTDKGQWLSLDIRKQKVLQKRFKDQTDVLIHTREAARLVGGTPLARPEGVQVDPVTHAIYACLTKNPKKGDHFGSILKIEEEKADHTSTTFQASTYLAGGSKNGFACPDNIVFDPAGNLWMTNDISGSHIGKGKYKEFGHNSLHCIPLRGPNAGRVFRIGSGPVQAELTGMSFTPDGKTLFVSVQHPGRKTKDLANPTSRWPGGGKQLPRPAVVAITGPALEAITNA